MPKVSLPFKVGVLMVLAVILVSAAGYLTFTNLSSIVASVNVKSRPDLRLLIIRSVMADLDMAGNSVRIYRLTGKNDDIRPYYTVISGIDEKIDSLKSASNNDTLILAQIDTIAALIEDNMLVWNEMIDLYHSDSLNTYFRALTAKIAVGSLNNKVTEKSILRRVFSRKALKAEEEAQANARQKIIQDLTRIEKQDSIKNFQMLASETKLAITGNEIRQRLYLVMSRMENDVIREIHNNSIAAEKLAQQTYKRLALFAVLGTLLVIAVLIVVVRFVRKTRQYEKALKKSNEETEKLAKTRELFVANMSHEIRTPVNAIHGFAEQLSHELLNEKSRSMLGIIQSTSEHLMRVVNDILDYSKLENATIELEKTHFLLQPVFEDVKMLFASNATAKNTTVLYSIDNHVPKALYGDAYRLKQILINLIGNSVKFTNNGEILFTAEVADLTASKCRLILTVADTGIGISKSMQGKVFDDFTQAEVGTSRKYGGTGLGLSIVRKLVELHKGDIKLMSEEGKGTTITCSIPYAIGNISHVPVQQTTADIPDRIKHLQILIVDDEDYNRLLFKTIFTRWKLKYDEAKDGLEAVRKVKTERFDLVFMDSRMPGLDGMKAATIIRHELKTSSPVIIGTSATHSAEDLRLYHDAGINTFLPKPFTEKMLLNAITSAMNNKVIPNHNIENKAGEQSKDTSEKIIDLTSLYHLANNDAPFIRQLLTSFIDTTESGLNGLQNAVNAHDFEAVREIAHKISSPCRHVGANTLYSRLKMIEEQALNKENIGILAKLSRECSNDFHEIKKGLQKHLETI